MFSQKFHILSRRFRNRFGPLDPLQATLRPAVPFRAREILVVTGRFWVNIPRVQKIEECLTRSRLKIVGSLLVQVHPTWMVLVWRGLNNTGIVDSFQFRPETLKKYVRAQITHVLLK